MKFITKSSDGKEEEFYEVPLNKRFTDLDADANGRIDNWKEHSSTLRQDTRCFLINARTDELSPGYGERVGIEEIHHPKHLKNDESYEYTLDMLKANDIETFKCWGHRFWFSGSIKAFTMEEWDAIPFRSELNFSTTLPMMPGFSSLNLDDVPGEYGTEEREQNIAKIVLTNAMKCGRNVMETIVGNFFFHTETPTDRVLKPNKSTLKLVNHMIDNYGYEDRRVQNG